MSALREFVQSTAFLEAQKAYQRGELSLEELKAQMLEALEDAGNRTTQAAASRPDRLQEKARRLRGALVEIGAEESAEVLHDLMREREAMKALR